MQEVWKVDKNSVFSEADPQSVLKKVPNFLFREHKIRSKAGVKPIKTAVCVFFWKTTNSEVFISHEKHSGSAFTLICSCF